MEKAITIEYRRWCERVEDPELQRELAAMREPEEAFYTELEFGTGGLRGVLGAGTNRMNIYTVAKASQGLANALKKRGGERIALSYDSRINSERFAREAAAVFAANGLKVFLYPRLMPTPVLSFTVRELSCAAGVMVTASHNPAKYNGYKVYGPDGCQITVELAAEVQAEIGRVDVFDGVRRMDFDEALAQGLIEWVKEEVYEAFIAAVMRQSAGTGRGTELSLVYTPLNGTGREPVTRILREAGFDSVAVVKEQEMPDGHFPTCPYPNPEIREALTLAIEWGRRTGAELILATDPDCDRVGIAVREADDYVLMSGNQVGALLIDFLIRTRKLTGKEAVVNTVVTSELGAEIARKAGIAVFSVLTGFKFIGERIGQFEERGDRTFLFGYEESYGYLAGTHARDKDAVVGSLLIAEMTAYWKARGKSLVTRMAELYAEFGFYRDALDSFTLEGIEGKARIGNMMKELRSGAPLFPGRLTDYSSPVPAEEGYGFLPTSNVLRYALPDGSWVAVRPSGTEPKIKIYYSVKGTDAAAAEAKLQAYRQIVKERLGLCR